jgi:hypothetical protein
MEVDLFFIFIFIFFGIKNLPKRKEKSEKKKRSGDHNKD